MTKQSADRIHDAGQTHKGLLDLAYKPIVFAGLTSIVIGSLVYLTLTVDTSLIYLKIWYGLLLAVAAGRIFAGVFYKYFGQSTLLFTVIWYFVTFYSAFVWASTPLLIWPESPALQSFIALVLAGMSGGILGTLSAMPLAIPLYVTICMTALIWRLSIAHTETSDAMMALGILYVLWVSIVGLRAHRTVRDSVISDRARVAAEKTIRHQAFHDDLTDLPNRRLFLDRLQSAINLSRRNSDYGAVLLIDVDNFKRVNDSLGHQAGDVLLTEIANRLKTRLRESDTAARLSGDEFAVVVPSIGHKIDDAYTKAEQLAAALRNTTFPPIVVDQREIQITLSVGIAGFPLDNHDALTVLKHADAAMYEAKKAGRNCARIFNHSMDEKAKDRLKTEEAIRCGLEREEFVNYYQPQVDHEGRLIGLEALVRWNRDGLETIGPGEFLGVAEESGLMNQIQDKVLAQVVQDIGRIGSILPNIGVSVNVSAGEFTRAGFIEHIKTMISKAGIPAHKLCIEITESMAMRQPGIVVEVMNQLREFGVRFAIDDFGTGYSSLAHLKMLPIDTLKIDRSFITDIKEGTTDAEIVKAIIAMTAQMGIRTIAEGVETSSVAEYLVNEQCKYHQGWVYGKAEPLERLFPALFQQQPDRFASPEYGLSPAH